MNNLALHYTFLRILKEFSGLSRCVSKQVAAMAVRDGRIISTGINGSAPGYINCNDLFDKEHFDRAMHHRFSEAYEIHAEMNCLLYAAKNGIPLDGSIMYCSLHPCFNCIKHISVVGIKTVIFAEKYDMIDPEQEQLINDYCRRLGIELIHMTEG